MATNPSTLTENIGRITAPDANYPYGSAKDDSTGTTGDGTPIKKAILDDTYGLQQALLAATGIVPSGTADNVANSQYLEAITELISGRAATYDETGVADAYVLAVRTNQHGPQSLFDGLRATFTPTNANTAASTVNVASLGVKDIRYVDGTALSGGELPAGVEASIVYDLANDYWTLQTPALYTSFSGSNLDLVGTDGFLRLPGGLVIQWGAAVGSGASSGTGTLSFPLAFPTALLYAAPIDNSNNETAAVAMMWDVGASSDTTLGYVWTNAGGSGTLANFRYFAIGY